MKTHRILFVCLGNICRSPLAEAICAFKVNSKGWSELVSCDSCGTSAYHQGSLADARSIAVAKSHGITISHRARCLTDNDFATFDSILVMDKENYKNVLQRTESEIYRAKVKMLRSYDPTANNNAEVPDPYYGGEQGFEEVYQMLDRAINGLLISFDKK